MGMPSLVGVRAAKRKKAGYHRCGISIGRKAVTLAAPVCFWWRDCGNEAVMEKGGKFVCSECSGKVNGLGMPIRLPMQLSHGCFERELANDLDMQETRHTNGFNVMGSMW